MHVCRLMSSWSRKLWFAVSLVAGLLAPAAARAQASSPAPVTLNDAVQLALKNYPAIARVAPGLRPRMPAWRLRKQPTSHGWMRIWRETRATHNNVFGLSLPQAVVPPVQGPSSPPLL